MATHFRDCRAWKDEGLSISTTNNEAARLFDAALSQYVSWKENDYFDGLDGTLKKLRNEDPNFGLGYILTNVLRFISTGNSPSKDSSFRADLDLTYSVCSKSPMNDREKMHLDALKLFDKGLVKEACEVYEEILLVYPTDMLAIKLSHDCYFYLGDKEHMKLSLENIWGAWKESMPLYEYLFGMKAFALCENRDYVGSEAAARKGLELNPGEGWSVHALAHNFEMTGRFYEGERFLNSTVLDWESCNLLACHLHWHNALYSIERGDYDRASEIFDDQVGKYILKSGAMLDIVDGCSLLYRLQMVGQNVRDKFNQIYDICLMHMDDRILTFNDLHFLMTFLGSGNRSQAESFVESLDEYRKANEFQVRDYVETNRSFGVPISKVMLDFDAGKFDQVVDALGPFSGEFIKIGGSDAQRDLFDQLLLNAAISSNISDHQELAKVLLGSRKRSPLTDHLMAKFLEKQMIRES